MSQPGHDYMKVLFATSEFADFAKAGGLGDVSAGLPQALQRCGIDVRVLLPAYPEVIIQAIPASMRMPRWCAPGCA
jgi:glycogen synthase